MLVNVLDALAQIGFRLTDGANIGGKIANLLLVDALDHDGGLVGRFELNILRRVQNDGIGKLPINTGLDILLRPVMTR
mgnify:CR=1 FL=1